MLDTATLALEVNTGTFVNFLRKNFHVTEEAAYGYICAKRRNHAYGNTNGKIDTAVKITYTNINIISHLCWKYADIVQR